MILYLLWAALNVVLLFFFLVLCVRAVRLIKEEYGGGAAIVFVFGLFAFGCNSNKTENPEQEAKQWKFSNSDSMFTGGAERLATVIVDKNKLTKHELGVRYYKNLKTRETTPISGYTTTTNMAWGTEWTPMTIVVNKINDDKFEYQMTAVEEWKLFNIVFYTKSGFYKGVVDL